MASKVYIGTSGWLYKHWVGKFYPEKSNAKQQWDFYRKHFDAIEVNNTFYKLPPPSVFENWYENSQKKMVFTIKANHFITHARKFIKPEESITRLFGSILQLKEKLGAILFQLPPKWKVNVERFAAFLKALPQGLQICF